MALTVKTPIGVRSRLNIIIGNGSIEGKMVSD
jgi:hypothetical protein